MSVDLRRNQWTLHTSFLRRLTPAEKNEQHEVCASDAVAVPPWNGGERNGRQEEKGPI
jgi:hypothetical protein